jgi:beta-galactosidase
MIIKSSLHSLKVVTTVVAIIHLFTSFKNNTDSVYTIDISQSNPVIISNHLKLGTNKNPKGETLDANSLYFIRNGKPWFPVMGEFHFSRYPKEQWEESILKMKAAGIDVIATYVFWIYHEEEEGKWDWSGNRDLKYFANLCAKHNVYLFARIGPWCHGEVRNGGFPDWLLAKAKTRKNDSTYLNYVTKFFTQINQQLKGFYFKDGGTVIGAQIENEFRFNNPAGLEHILTLKKIARDAGIDVPYYTATGWPGSNLKQSQLIPVWGAYPEAPWDKSTGKLKPSENYLFGTLRSDPAIGSDLLGSAKDTTNYAGYRYPYATAEMGGGNQITYHRRPIINADDVTSLAYVKTGSGANLMGYYMFHGGSNAIGKLSTFQESKATKYPNDYPIINYDFYSPIGEWGQLRPSYRSFKAFHLFLTDFGDKLAQTTASFPSKMPSGPADANTLRWAVRSNNNSGFIFINNYQRQVEMHDMQDVQFNIKTKDGVMQIPQQAVTIKKDAQIIWPFNLNMEGATLKYATAQLLCRLSDKEEATYVCFANEGIKPEFVFENKAIQSIQSKQAFIIKTDTTYKVDVTKPGTACLIELKLKNGKTIKVLTLTGAQALNAWKGNINRKEALIISDDDLIFIDGKVRMQSTGNPDFNLAVYPGTPHLNFGTEGKVTTESDGVFTKYSFSMQSKSISISYKEDKTFNSLSTSQSHNVIPASMPLYGANLKPINAKYWKVSIPKNALTGLSDAFLKVDYRGDTYAAYFDDKLVADDFYAGLPMTLSLKQLGSKVLGKNLVMLVTPLNDSSKIYFEDGIREPLKGRRVCEIRSITLVPQYQVMISLK